MQRARYSAPKTKEQWHRAIEDNLMVLLLRRRDGAALGQLMRDHIKSKTCRHATAALDIGIDGRCVTPRRRQRQPRSQHYQLSAST
jgi:hypothetical protein